MYRMPIGHAGGQMAAPMDMGMQYFMQPDSTGAMGFMDGAQHHHHAQGGALPQQQGQHPQQAQQQQLMLIQVPLNGACCLCDHESHYGAGLFLSWWSEHGCCFVGCKRLADSLMSFRVSGCHHHCWSRMFELVSAGSVDLIAVQQCRFSSSNSGTQCHTIASVPACDLSFRSPCSLNCEILPSPTPVPSRTPDLQCKGGLCPWATICTVKERHLLVPVWMGCPQERRRLLTRSCLTCRDLVCRGLATQVSRRRGRETGVIGAGGADREMALQEDCGGMYASRLVGRFSCPRSINYFASLCGFVLSFSLPQGRVSV